ncbi:hypothetical protein [Chelativorans alearense]|uniref:hypothetical protein n=1 Tax=Chelativorans alearense TaxID=2681495 RepID=UPI0013D04F29|nr:hypothetical protein [Chelativorans alearense]
MMRRRAMLYGMLYIVVAGAVEGHAVTPELSPAQKPLRSVVIAVPPMARERFFAQLRQFADTHGFAIRIAPTTPDGEYIGVQMYREGLKVLGNSVWKPEKFDFAFYPNSDHPVPSGSVDKLLNDLKQTVENVPGVTVSETE